MKKKTLFIITLIIGILLSFFIYSNIDLLQMIQYLLLVLSYKLIPYLFVTFLIHLLATYRWNFILKSMKFKIPFYKLFLYKLMGYAISYITPGAHVGGEPVRAILLKRHKIEFSKGLSSVVIDKSIEITFNVFFGFIAFLILIFNYTIPLNSVVIIYSLVLILIFFFIFFYRMSKGFGFISPFFKYIKIKYKYQKKVREFERNISDFFKFHKKAFYKAIIISSLCWILMFIEYAILLSLLHIDVTFVNIFLVLIGVVVAYIIPLPAALGVLEIFQISIFKIIKLNASYAVVASIIIRIKDLFWTGLGLLLLSYYGVKIKFFENDKKKS